jgi:hypothetical protein
MIDFYRTLKNGGRFTTLSKVPVPSDHKSLDHKSLVGALRQNLGDESVLEMPAKITSEDFSEYGRAGVRAVLLHIGAVNPATLASGAKVPDLHSPQWFPELEPTLRSLVAAEVVMLTDLLAAHGNVGE